VDATNPAAFASQVINTTSGARTVTITNTGVANLLISGVSLGGANPASFTATADPACSTLVPGASCSVTVTFTPTTTGALTADLVIASNAPNSPTRVPVSGTAIPVPAPALGPLPGPQAFGNQALTTTSAARVIAISNTGTAALSLSSIALAGTAASQFTMSPGPGCTTVAPAATCNVSVSFRPTTTGAKTASLVITHNAPGSPSSVALSGTGVVAAPSAPTIGVATRGNTTATVRWSVPASTGGSPITGYSVRIYLPQGPTPNVVIRTLAAAGGATTSVTVTGLLNGTSYNFDVRAVNAVGTGAPSARSNTVTPATVPGTPGIGIATAGTAGGAITATARWAAPGTGGSPITGYVVRALRIAANGTVLSTTTSAVQPAAARLLTMTLPVNANYRFTVQAINAVGSGAQSARSNLVRGQ
jgi:hypothetical protein